MSKLDQHIGAYSDDFHYAFDNEIMLNSYPARIMQLCKGSGSLLELGIGHGYTTNLFSRHFDKHVVIDGSQSVIKQFQNQYPDCSAFVSECYFEDFKTDELFDVIIMGFILEHVMCPRDILEKYKRFLAPGGRCFITVPNGESMHRRIGKAAGLLDDMMSLGKGDLQLGHERTYSVSTLSAELEAVGYTVVRKEGIFLKPFTTEQLVSLNLSKEIISGLCDVAIDYPELSAALLFEVSV